MPGAMVLTSHCWGSTCPSGPTASRATCHQPRPTSLACLCLPPFTGLGDPFRSVGWVKAGTVRASAQAAQYAAGLVRVACDSSTPPELGDVPSGA